MDPQSRLHRWEKHAEWPLAAVAVVFLAAFSVEVLARPRGATAVAVDVVTWAVWGIFAVDYVVRLVLAPDRRRWFLHHLLDLAIVALPLLRPLRLLRLVVLVAAFQQAVGNAIRGRVVVYTVSGAVLLIYVASLAILQAERGQPEAHINTFGQALWWSMTTITTVGYGDLTPVTATGRIIAVLLMIGGITLVGSITATLASWIVQRVAEADTQSQAATAAQIEDLRTEIRSLRHELRGQYGE
jgi:voltage-gated potassium channel